MILECVGEWNVHIHQIPACKKMKHQNILIMTEAVICHLMDIIQNMPRELKPQSLEIFNLNLPRHTALTI